jgi:hypothetical protein
MSKTRSKRPSNDTRTHRRSLLELTAEVSRAVDDGLSARPATVTAIPADEPPRSERVAEKRERTARVSSDSAAEMVVKIAKDYQNNVLDNIKAGLNAALDQAKDFAETKRADEQKGDAGAENNFLAALGAVTAAYRAEALELMQANVATTLDYARGLAGARTAAEVAELSGTQARKGCELMLRQADVLKSFAEAVAKERDRA